MNNLGEKMRITVYVGNGNYVDTIDIDDDADKDDILEIATEAALEWVQEVVYWETEDD